MNFVLSLSVLLTIASVNGTITFESIVPNFGIYYGGVNVTISVEATEEEEFDAENFEVLVFLVDSNDVSIPCSGVEKRREKMKLHINLTTPEVKNESFETTVKLVIIFMKNESNTQKIEGVFHLKPNPVVEKSFEPSATILSGGVKVFLEGRNLDSSTTIYLRAIGMMEDGTHWSTKESCEILSSVRIMCKTPKLLISEEALNDIERIMGNRTSSENLFIPEARNLKFLLSTDGLKHALDMPKIYPDPTVRNFPDVQVFVANRVNGRIYTEGVWPKDFPSFENSTRILVGGKDCSSVARENESHLSCVPPPMKSHVIRNGLPHVTTLPVKVIIGHVEYSLGDLKYEEEEEFIKSTPIIVMIVILSFVVVSTVIFGILTSRSSRKTRRRAARSRRAKAARISRAMTGSASDDGGKIDAAGDDYFHDGFGRSDRKVSAEVRRESIEVESLLAQGGDGQGQSKV